MTRSELVGFAGERWDRRVQVTSLSEGTALPPPPSRGPLHRHEVIGFLLIDALKAAAAPQRRTLSY